MDSRRASTLVFTIVQMTLIYEEQSQEEETESANKKIPQTIAPKALQVVLCSMENTLKMMGPCNFVSIAAVLEV